MLQFHNPCKTEESPNLSIHMSLSPECQGTHNVDPHRSQSYSGSWNTFSLDRDIDFCAQSCVQSLLWRITYNQSSLPGLTGPRDFSLKNTVCSSRLSLTSLKLSVGNWNLSIKRADKCLLACIFGSWLKHDTELAQVVDSWRWRIHIDDPVSFRSDHILLVCMTIIIP
jgi:hypothetical protein